MSRWLYGSSSSPEKVILVDRDLLALRYSRLNLVLNECPPERVSTSHQVGIGFATEEKVDLFIGVLREEEGKEATFLTLDQATRKLSANGMIIVTAGSTAITRLVDYVESQGLLRIKDTGAVAGL